MRSSPKSALRVVAVVLGVLCSSCSGTPAPTAAPAPQVVARVGSTAISGDLFQARLHSALTAVRQGGGPTNNSAMTAQLRASVLRSLLIDTVIAQEAAAARVAASSVEVEAQVSADAQSAGGMAQLQTRLASIGGSLTQLRDEIRSSLNEQRLEALFAAQRATEIERQLAAGATFGVLAAQYSDDAVTAARGGALGEVPRAQVLGDDPAYAAPVLALTPGWHTDPPIRDAQGYDIVALDASTLSFLTLRHIIVDAPQPYTVKERPTWFAEAIFEALAQDCGAGKINIYIGNVGDDPCAAAAPSTTPGPGGSAAPTAQSSP